MIVGNKMTLANDVLGPMLSTIELTSAETSFVRLEEGNSSTNVEILNRITRRISLLDMIHVLV